MKLSIRKLSRATGILALQVLIPLALVLIGGEIWARMAQRGDESNNSWPAKFDPGVGFVFKPNATVRWSNGLDYDVTQLSNVAGFLDRPLPDIAKPAGTCRVAFVGDSFVEAAQVPIEKKVQVVFETLARTRWPGLAVETMATGYSGTGQLNQLPFYDRFIEPRQPDVVVLVFVSNDFSNNSNLLEAVRNGWHPRHAPRLFARKQDGGIELQPIDPDWQDHQLPAPANQPTFVHKHSQGSHFYQWLYKKISIQYPTMAEWISGIHRPADIYAYRIGQLSKLDNSYLQPLAEWGYPDAPGIDGIFYKEKITGIFQDAIDFTGFALDQFKERAARQGARLAVLTSYNVKGLYLERLRGLTDPRDISLISQHETLQANGMAEADMYFRHDGHWSETGHRQAAEQLVELFASEGLCGAF